MNTKLVILIIVLLYMISPADACPGPVDDLIVALIGYSIGKEM